MPNIAPHNPVQTPQNQVLQTDPSEGPSNSFQNRCMEQLEEFKEINMAEYLPRNQTAGAEGGSAAVLKFRQSDRFADFKGQLIKSLEYIHVNTSEPPMCRFDQSNWGRFAARLGLIQPQADTEVLSHELYQIYGESCALLNRMSLMLKIAYDHSAKFPAGTRQQLIGHLKDLRGELFVCGPGLMQKISSIYISMKYQLLPPDLQTLYKHTRLQTARDQILRMVRLAFKRNPLLPGNEIHMVAAFQNRVAEALDLPLIDDIYAAQHYVTDAGYTANTLTGRLAPLLSSTNICSVIAGMAFDQLKGYMAEVSGDSGEKRNPYKDFTESMDRLKPMIGEVSPSRFFDVDTYSDLEKLKVFENPILLASDLYERLQKLHLARLHCPPPSKYLIQKEDGSQKLLKSVDSMIWVEETTDKDINERHLKLNDLTPEAIDRVLNSVNFSRGTATFMAYEALRNSDLPELLYFRQVPAFPALTDLTKAAVAAAYSTLPDGHCNAPRLIEYLAADQSPMSAARLLLSENAELLSEAQEDYLLDQCWNNPNPVAEGTSASFAIFAMSLDELPQAELFKPSPRLFKKLLEKTQPNDAEVRRQRNHWLNDSNPAYLKSAREVPGMREHMPPRWLLPILIDRYKGPSGSAYLPLVIGLVDELVAPEAPAADFYGLVYSLIDSAIPDVECALMIEKLIGKSTTDLDAPQTFDDLRTSSLAAAFQRQKPACAKQLLTNYQSNLPAATHQYIWLLFREMFTHARGIELAPQLLDKLLEKGVRVNLTEVPTSALLTIGLGAPHEINQKLVQLGCDPAARNQGGHNLLEIAIMNKVHWDQINDMLNLGVPVEKVGDSYPAVDEALGFYRPDQIGELYKKVGNLNELDDNGYSILHKAILKAGNGDLMEWEKMLEIHRIRAMLYAGCDPNLRTSSNHMYKTPLHLAQKYFPEASQTLIANGAKPYSLDLKMRFAKNMKAKNR